MALTFLGVVFLALPLLTGIERHRLRATVGVVIPAQPTVANRLSVQGIVAVARSRATWRQLSYHLLAAPALAVGAITVVGVWLAGILFTLVYVYAWKLPAGGLLQRGQSSSPLGHLPLVSYIPVDVSLTAGGIALLAAAPWLTNAVAALDARAARALLGPSRAEELEYQVERLAQTRAGVVDAADAERRRLERDLHDGTQQRLVSLAMRLGMARAERPDAAQAHQIIAEAHEEAKAALLELRHLVRGLHPAVLEDRGLDAALSGVAARLPIPVRLTVDVPAGRRRRSRRSPTSWSPRASPTSPSTPRRARRRCSCNVPTTGCTSSSATTAWAAPIRPAAPASAGLAKRAASVDGTFDITSPPGGPTLLTVDLPCAR